MNPKRILQRLVLTAFLSILPLSTAAQSPPGTDALINFDNVSDGTLINSAYSALGVTFDCHLGSDSTMNVCTGTNSTGFGGHVYARTPTAFGVSSSCSSGWIPDPALAKSSPNVVSIHALVPCPGSPTFFNQQNGYLVARFPTPAASVSIFANAVFPPESLGTTTNMPYMNAYDVNGKFLRTVEYATGPIGQSLGWLEMTITPSMVNNIPIGSVVISSSFVNGSSIQVWGEFDNFSFTFSPTTVPNVVGKTLSNAEAALTAAKLVVGTVTEAPSSTVPAGDVTSQNPAGGTAVNPGTSVNLVVSCGPSATVPNVLGKTQAAAQTAISTAKLVVGTVTHAPSSTVAAGDVDSQTPKGGTTVCGGTKVNLTVSCGPPATVPDVLGKTQAAAQTAISTAKLVVGTVTHAPSSTVAAGDVDSQTPKGGTTVCGGTKVNLTVSCGLPTTVPNVVGLPATTAKTDITNAHLVIGTLTTAHDSRVPAGDVISQSPKGGTVVCRGTAVSGVISLGP